KPRVPAEVKERILRLAAEGVSQKKIADLVGVSTNTVTRTLNALPTGVRSPGQLRRQGANPPKAFDELSDIGKRSLESFETFARTFFVLRVAPWWKIASDEIVSMVLSPEREFELFHAPVGA